MIIIKHATIYGLALRKLQGFASPVSKKISTLSQSCLLPSGSIFFGQPLQLTPRSHVFAACLTKPKILWKLISTSTTIQFTSHKKKSITSSKQNGFNMCMVSASFIFQMAPGIVQTLSQHLSFFVRLALKSSHSWAFFLFLCSCYPFEVEPINEVQVYSSTECQFSLTLKTNSYSSGRIDFDCEFQQVEYIYNISSDTIFYEAQAGKRKTKGKVFHTGRQTQIAIDF